MAAAVFLGRQAELAELERRADDVRSERCAAVVTVLGDAGIGKTTLLGAFRPWLTSSGFTVLRAALSPAETPLTWAGLHSLLRPLPDEALRALIRPKRIALLAALGRTDAEVDPGQVGVAVADLLEIVAARSPVALVVDDVHWLDAATAGAVAFAVRSAEAAPILTVLAARPDHVLPVEGDRLLAPDRSTRLELSGLSTAGVHQLLSRAFGVSLRRPELIRLHAATGGNPLHVVETGRLLTSGRTFEEALLPPSLSANIAARLEELPATTRRCLEAAALVAAPTVELVQQALPELEVEGSLLVAEEAAVIEVRGDSIAFRHPLLRGAVLDGLPGLRRRRLLRDLAVAVEDPDERALLLADATVGHDEAIADAVEEAGHRASSRGVPILAAERYRRAAACSVDPEARARRLVEAAEASYSGGDPVGALEPAEEGYALTCDPDLRLRAGMCAVLTLAYTDDLTCALARAESLLVDLDGDAARQARVLRTIARIRAFDDVDAAAIAIERALELARRADDAHLLAHTEAVAALVRQQRGEPVDVDSVVSMVADQLADAPVSTRSLALELLTWTDHVEEAINLGWALLAEAEANGSIDDMGGIRDQLADACFRAGRWDEAVALVRATLEADRIAMTRGPADCRPADLAQTLAAQGRHDEAAALLAEVIERDDLAPVIRLQRAARAGFVSLAAGRFHDAAAHLREARREALALHEGDLGAIPFRADLVEALVAVGDLDEAAEVAEEHRCLAEHSRLPRGLAEAARCRGLVAMARGDHAAAVVTLEEARELHLHWPVPFERARTLLVLGAALRRCNRRSQAAAHLDEAAAVFEQLGSMPWLARVDAERERLGRRRADGQVLTPTEQRVAELVAQGRTNADIASALVVSLRTVESNLTRIFRKVGVRSRTELAARLRDGL